MKQATRNAKRTLVVLGFALASCRGPVLSPTASPQAVHVRMLATTATYPLLQDCAAAYQPVGQLLAIDAAAAGWATIYARVQAGDVPYAFTTALAPETPLWATQIGWDGIAIIVHAALPITVLTRDELRLIYQGRTASWSALDAGNVPVTVVSREDGADTRLAFEALVMDGRRTTPGARLALSSASVVELVAETPGAVGYVSMSFADERVRVVALEDAAGGDAQLPTPETVSAGNYSLRVPVLVVGQVAPEPGSVYYEWFAWMQSQPGQMVIGARYGMVLP
ncbi:MAG: substrate-binding domain-containing protein [Anaerolineae bacterium]|nr:substrate-binding domain-containing protein [Anaerolineae bacterium]